MSDFCQLLLWAIASFILCFILLYVVIMRSREFHHFFVVDDVIPTSSGKIKVCRVIREFKNRKQFEKILKVVGYRYVRNNEYAGLLEKGYTPLDPINLNTDMNLFPINVNDRVALVPSPQ